MFLFIGQAAAVTYWHKMGSPKEKLNIGLPFYGRTFTLVDPKETYLGARAKGAGKNGTVTRIGGFLSYFEVTHFFFLFFYSPHSLLSLRVVY